MNSAWLSIPIAIILFVLVFLGLRQARGQSPPGDRPDPPTGMSFLKPPTLTPPTLGGKQFWADVLFFHGWRIQRNVSNGGYRLLDGNNLRHASGSFEQCRDRLEKIKREQNLPPMSGKAVVVLHGLIRSRSSMSKLCDYLRKRGRYQVFNVTYPSTREPIARHAQGLQRIIENLEGIDEINLVGHSLGNIVVRKYLAGGEGKGLPDGRIGRAVMLAPPNHGSRIAAALGDNAVFRLVNGPAGQELGCEWDEFKGELAMPDVEFGIIAGGRGDLLEREDESPDNDQAAAKRGYNPWLPGDNDGTLTVACTRLAGARDFVVLPAIHSFIMNDKTVHEYTLRFLQHGCFISADRRCPIETARGRF